MSGGAASPLRRDRPIGGDECGGTVIITRDEAFRIVCSILTDRSDGSTSVGTGSFVTTNGRDAWLLTASHVASSTNRQTIIAVGNENDDCITVPLPLLNAVCEWITHPIADIALMEININKANMGLLKGRCLPFDHFNHEKRGVSRDAELTSVGFPNGLGIDGKFSPLTFRSYAASSLVTLNRADTKTPSDFFCLENPSCGGYSGCPVLDLGYMVVGNMTSTGEKTICYGIMHGTISDDTGGKLALVTPSYYLDDLLQR